MSNIFPWFGGKSLVADEVWRRFGNPCTYIEPFAGSLAVLINRPQLNTYEYVNDINCYLVNFWRALKADNDELYELMDYPVSEIDSHLRQNWLISEGSKILQQTRTDIDFYDLRAAAWWAWGLCFTIGGTNKWCSGDGAWKLEDNKWVKGKPGVDRQKPSDPGGYMSCSLSIGERKQLVMKLGERLRNTVILSGDWKRVLSGYILPYSHVGVFLDPPYDGFEGVYGIGGNESISAQVNKWAIENQDNYKIALCGYRGEHKMPDGWDCYRWKANGGYSNQSTGNRRDDECIWFNSLCNNGSKNVQQSLFGIR